MLQVFGSDLIDLVRATGIEPASQRHKILNLTRMPISPRPQSVGGGAWRNWIRTRPQSVGGGAWRNWIRTRPQSVGRRRVAKLDSHTPAERGEAACGEIGFAHGCRAREGRFLTRREAQKQVRARPHPDFSYYSTDGRLCQARPACKKGNCSPKGGKRRICEIV